MSRTKDYNRKNESSTRQQHVDRESNSNAAYEETPDEETPDEETPYEEASFEDADRETSDVDRETEDSSRPEDIPFDQAVSEYENPELG